MLSSFDGSASTFRAMLHLARVGLKGQRPRDDSSARQLAAVVVVGVSKIWFVGLIKKIAVDGQLQADAPAKG
jgi:hypothetical protein